jgi:hypothetical protein
VKLSTPTCAELTEKIAKECNVSQDNICISCTHTHSGPLFDTYPLRQTGPSAPEDACKEFKSKILDAVKECIENLVPAKCAWATAEVDGVGCNRHSPDRPRDPEVGIMLVKNADTDKLISVSTFYSMHPTVMHEDSKLISSDFPHYTREKINEKFGYDTIVLYFNGAAGNQSPRYHVKGQTFEEAERIGGRLGDFICETISKVNDNCFSDNIKIKAKVKNIDLPKRDIVPVEEAKRHLQNCRDEFERLKNENAGHGPIRTAECTVFGAEKMAMLAELKENGTLDKAYDFFLPARIQAIRVGDAFITTVPGEIFVEFSLEVKKNAPGKTFFAAYSNGTAGSYIVTQQGADEQGYEASGSLYTPEAGHLMAQTAIELVTELNEK